MTKQIDPAMSGSDRPVLATNEVIAALSAHEQSIIDALADGVEPLVRAFLNGQETGNERFDNSFSVETFSDRLAEQVWLLVRQLCPASVSH